jgi:hypothetical protein
MMSSEVEKKSATPCSSERTREGPEKLEITFPLSFLTSAALDLNENRRIGNMMMEGVVTMSTSGISTSLVAITMMDQATYHSVLLRACSGDKDVE